MKYCKCHDRLTLKQCINALTDEIKEFKEDPSKDEASDVVYCLNRMAGSVFGKSYVKVFPGDQLHVDKIKVRMEEYGCIRSKNHLIFDRCPSLFNPNKGYIELSHERVIRSHNSIFHVGMKFPGFIFGGIFEHDLDGKNLTRISCW